MERRVVRTCLVALAVMLHACGYDPEFEDCAIKCSVETGCPDGLECSLAGFCSKGENIDDCQMRSDGGLDAVGSGANSTPDSSPSDKPPRSSITRAATTCAAAAVRLPYCDDDMERKL